MERRRAPGQPHGCRSLAVLCLLTLAWAGCSGREGPSRDAIRVRALALFAPLPEEAASEERPLTDERIKLGRMLYYDPRLSKSHEISCNSCHALTEYGVDHEPTSEGHAGQRGDRNAPTVYNAALHVAQFWDGRAPDVEEQAKGPIQNPIEMALTGGEHAVKVVRSIPGYAPLFAAAFPGEEDPITFDNLATAIAAFERRLLTPSRFDRFLEGDVGVLTDEEIAGLSAFMDLGCPTCHMGTTVGGGMFQKLGLVHPYETEDPGRQRVTGQESDRGVFKVPSMRNVERTGPYFHDGSIATLEEAVRKMAWHQLGREIGDTELDSIIEFLRSLTGEIDQEYVARPALPESGPDTPPPDHSTGGPVPEPATGESQAGA